MNRAMAVRMLQGLGVSVTEAANGQQAVERFTAGAESSGFDLVLMDVHMPVMDGWEATRRIRACTAGGSIPIVALTASALRADREACLAAGMNDHMSKPFRPSDLAAILGLWLPAARGRLDLDAALQSAAGDEDLRTRLLTVFRRDMTEKLQGVRDAAERDDQAALFGIGHSLKGSAEVMGAFDLARAARALESAARDQRATAVQVEGVISSVEATVAAVDAALALGG